ncbi:MAG: DegT/DnrJ/EryC1/StrS family aminotransferase [Cyanobacteriota bacterium]
MIPILDLTRQYSKIKDQVDKAVLDVIESGHYIIGPNVKKLESDAAKYLGCKRAIGVANGTDALHLALRALDIGPGDEVITVAFTFVATTEAIGIVGAAPVFADIDPDTYNIDPNDIEAKITNKTRAILPVHLYGQPCDMDPIMELAKKYKLYVVEDCAQAIGAEYKGKKVGTFGEFGCFSFFPTKNLGCYGDGGMVTANCDKLADRVVALRGHGGRIKYYHDELGLNSRLDEMQAAVLNVKLPYIDEWNKARRDIAYRYNDLLKDVEGVVTPEEIDNVNCVYHQYTIRVPNRDNMQKALKDSGVITMIYYPVPLHKQKVHAHIESPALPVTDAATEVVLSLPIFPELTQDEQVKVVEAIKQNVKALAKA